MRFLASLLLIVAIAVGAGYLALQWEAQFYDAPGPSSQETVVVVAPGTSLRAIAQELADARAIQYPLAFRAGATRRHQTNLQAGEYGFPAGASEAKIIDMMVHGQVLQHKLTVAEGLTSAAALAIIAADPVLQGDTPPTPPEGTLLPETYLFVRGTTRAELLARMEKAQTDLLTEHWEKRTGDLPYERPQQALILASIVEKETALAQERPHVASVFVNRLRLHMKLESDPTIIYGLTGGVPLGHDIRASEMAAPNPYNTYQIDGLPPSPICNPSREAILAVLNPPDTKDLYFVANGTGGSSFAATLEEHNKNVAKWRQIQSQH